MSNLISVSTYLSLLDRMASIYNRAIPVLGTSLEYDTSDLAGAITSSATTLTLDSPISGTWSTLLPAVGRLLIDSEEILYSGVAGNVITLCQRGYNTTIPAAHSDEATVYLPASAGKYAELALQDLVGDGTTANLLVGAPSYDVISDLGDTFNGQIARVIAQGYFQQIAPPYFQRLSNHIAKRAPGLLTGTPSFGALSVSDINTFARYQNDNVTGTPYSCLISWQVAKIWFWCNSGSLLDNKVVWAPQTSLYSGTVTGAGPTVTGMAGTNLLRIGVPDSTLLNYQQGYSAMPLRARCTVAGTGNITITCTVDGQDGVSGAYFGRTGDTSTSTRTVSGTLDLTAVGNTVAISNGNGDRVHAITATPTYSGTSTSGQWVVESIPARSIK